MKRLLTINDFIHAYFTYYGNGEIQSSLYQHVNMMTEMNEIKEDYDNIGSKWPKGETITIELVLRKCVRGIMKRGHQWCISTKAIDDAVKALCTGTFVSRSGKKEKFVAKGRIYEDFEDFEDLYDAVKSLISIPGIGEVTIYDTARRIGHILDTPIYPQQFVYLPANKVRNAACFIVGKEVEGKEPASLFFPYFGTLSPLFIEDILCIFSKWFWRYAKCPKELPCPPYSKVEKRIGLPWWSLEVKTFRKEILDEYTRDACKKHERWNEFPMISYPSSKKIKRLGIKGKTNPCSVCINGYPVKTTK